MSEPTGSVPLSGAATDGEVAERERADVKALADQAVVAIVGSAGLSITVSDPTEDDNPITYVNAAFEELTGYSANYAIGRNCRFLQGEGTDPATAERIRRALSDEEEISVVIRNYRADGAPFWNELLISPVFGEDGALCAFLAVQRAVESDRASGIGQEYEMLREMQHRVKNHLSMIVSMIRVQSRREITKQSLESLRRRIEALALLYDEMMNTGYKRDGEPKLEVGAYLSRIVNVLSSMSARDGVRINIQADECFMPPDTAARLGLLLSELLTNSLNHAFTGRNTGVVDVAFRVTEEGRAFLRVADDGIGLPEGINWPEEAESIAAQRARAETAPGVLDTTGDAKSSGVGGSIVLALARSLRAPLEVKSDRSGTIASISVAV